MQRFLTFCIILLINVATIYGQPTTAGKDFWLSFGKNDSYPSSLQIKIVTTEDTEVTITPASYSLQGGGITANYAHRVTLIPADVYSDAQGKSSKSLRIQTDKDVLVYAVNMGSNSTDATSILPTYALGNSYYHLSYTPTSWDGYTIVAVEDGTIIYENGSMIVTLNRGEVYSSYFSNDGSGKYLTSNHNFAYFVTNPSTKVPANVSYSDCLYQQIYPTKWWGRHFFVPVTIRGEERVRILALQNNTKIYTDATLVDGSLTLNKGEWAEFKVNAAQKGCYIKTTYPVAVASYLTGQEYGGYSLGDPSMTWIPPIQQYVNEINIAPFTINIDGSFNPVYGSSALSEHHLLIVAPTSVKDSTKIKLGGNGTYDDLSGGIWYDHPSSGYSYYNLPLTNPAISYYSIRNSESLFVYAYGLGDAESYYYLAGSTPLEDTYFEINGINYQSFGDTIICDGNIDVEAFISYRMDTIPGHLRWLINDVEQTDFTDSLHWTTNLQVGNYTVMMIAKYKFNNEPDTLFTSFVVSEPKNTIINDTICQHYAYEQYGFTIPLQNTAGLVTDTLKLTTVLGCDSIVYLNLRVNPVEKTFINDTICQGESYNKYGFSLPPQTIAGTNCDFTLQLLTVQGCDSIVTLCLTVNKPAQPPVFASICEGESYYFHDNYYYVSGIYEHYVSGCGGIDTLVLTVNPTYYSEQTDCICPGEIYTFNGYNYDREGDYIVTLKTVNGCDSILYLRLPPCPPEMCCMPVIPNTFTPDGINNIFMRGYRIQIYTRNGLLLYDGKDGWDGTYKGRPVEKDTYFYILYCPPTIQGIETKNGYIVLIR